MAKKVTQSAKKAGKSGAGKAKKASASKAPAAKKPAAKPAKSKPATKASAHSGKTVGVMPVSTGSGMSVMEVAQAQMARIRQGDYETGGALYSKDLVSVEGAGVNMAFHGMPAVDAKNKDWMGKNKLHGCSAEGPFVGSNCFAIKFVMDVEDTVANQRMMMSEVAVYTVANGKIVREEFMYDCAQPA
jgi:ketosteroid isomerase-like protein